MKKEKFKNLLLPIGLLIMGSAYFFTFSNHSGAIDFGYFIKGLGFAFVLSALFFKSKFYFAKN